VRESVAAALKGAGVIRQLLAFSRRQLMRLEVMSLNRVVGDTESLLKHLLRENIHLEFKLAPDVTNIKADPVQITQVILNLALNSRDAMPEGGLLEITTENHEIAANPKGSRQIPPGHYVRLCIRDNGTGMDEATKSHIFEPFFTTKETGKGTGLGLSTVYGIVTQSAGYIEFDSDLGAGTTFSIYFPRCDELLAEAPVVAPVQRQSVAVPYSVLVVEDDAMVRASISEALQREGFQVYSSGSPQEAWEIALRERPSLVVADVVIGGTKGTELVEHLRKEDPSIQTIFISDYGDEEMVVTTARAEDSVFIPKPFTINELVESAVRLCKAKR
jgi:two-component system cell cycle sensor histidine kinase/response regulator CckA